MNAIIVYSGGSNTTAVAQYIAEKTGGRYFGVSDRDSLESALEEIDQLEKTELEADAWNRWDEHFALPLLAGALLVFVAVSLSMAAARRLA